MTQMETAKVLEIISSAYNTKQVTDTQVKVWASLFKEEHIDDVMAAVFYYIENSDSAFAPNAAQIKSTIRLLFRQNNKLDTGAIYSEIERASRNSAYHYLEEYTALSPEAKKVVGSPSILREYANMPRERMMNDIRKGIDMLADELASETPTMVKQYLERRKDATALLQEG